MDEEDAFDLGDLPISDQAKAAIVRRHLNWPAENVYEASDRPLLAYLPHASPAGFILSPIYRWVHDCGIPAQKRTNRHKRAYSSPELPDFHRTADIDSDRGRGRARKRTMPPSQPEHIVYCSRQALARTPGTLRRDFIAASPYSNVGSPSTAQLVSLSSFIDFLCVNGHFAPPGSQTTSLYTRSPSASPAPPQWSPSTSRSLSRVRAASRSVSRAPSTSRAPSHPRLAPAAASPSTAQSAVPETRLLVPDEESERTSSSGDWDEDFSNSRSALFPLSRASPYSSSHQSPLRSQSVSGSGSGPSPGEATPSSLFNSTFVGRPLSVVERYLDSAPWEHGRFRVARTERERTPLLPSDAMSGRSYTFTDSRSCPVRPVGLHSTVRTSMLFARHLLTPVPLLLYQPNDEPRGMTPAIFAVAVVAIASTYTVAHARPSASLSRTLTEGLGVLGHLGQGGVSLSLAAAYLSDLSHLVVELHPWWRCSSLPGITTTTQAPHMPPRDITRRFVLPLPGWVYGVLLGASLIPSVLARHSKWVKWGSLLAEVAMLAVLLGTSCILYTFPARDAGTVPLTSLIPLTALALSHLGPVPDLVARMVHPALAPRALIAPLMSVSILLICSTPPSSPPRVGDWHHRGPSYTPLAPSALDLLPHEVGWVVKAVAVGALVLRTPTSLACAIQWFEQRWMSGRSGKFDPWIKARKNMVRLGALGLSTAVGACCVHKVLILASLLGMLTALPSLLIAPVLAWPAPTSHARGVIPALGCALGALGLVLTVLFPYELWS